MKAHELARQLLAGPDVEVVVAHPKFMEWANLMALKPHPEKYYRYPERAEEEPKMEETRLLILEDEAVAYERSQWPEFEDKA